MPKCCRDRTGTWLCACFQDADDQVLFRTVDGTLALGNTLRVLQLVAVCKLSVVGQGG